MAARRTLAGVAAAGRWLRAPRVARVVERIRQVSDADVLVEVGVPVPRRGRVLILGSDPYDERITCLADLRTSAALPEAAFDVVALTDARPRRDFVVVENAVRALRPDGVLVCGATWPVTRALTRQFETVTKHGIGPWRVVEARGGPNGHR